MTVALARGGVTVGRAIQMAAFTALLLFAKGASAATIVEPRLQVGLEGRYDDDALLRHDDADAPVTGEVLSKLSGQGGLRVENRTLTLDAWYAPDLQFRYFSGTTRVDHRAGVDLATRLTARTRLTGEVRAWRVSDPTSLPRTGMGRSLSPVLYGTVESGLHSRLTRTLDGRVGYRFEGTQLLEDGAPPGSVHAPSAELSYRLNPRATVGAEYRFQYFLYGPERAMAHAPVALFRYRTGTQTVLVLSGGPVFYMDSRGSQDGIAPRVHVQFTRAFRGFEASAQVGQDLVGATGFTSAVWAQYAGLYASLRLSRQLHVFSGAYAFRNGPAPGDAQEWLSITRSADMLGYAVGGGLEWSLTRHVALQGQVDRISQVGTYGPDVDLSRNVVAIRLVARTW